MTWYTVQPIGATSLKSGGADQSDRLARCRRSPRSPARRMPARQCSDQTSRFLRRFPTISSMRSKSKFSKFSAHAGFVISFLPVDDRSSTTKLAALRTAPPGAGTLRPRAQPPLGNRRFFHCGSSRAHWSSRRAPGASLAPGLEAFLGTTHAISPRSACTRFCACVSSIRCCCHSSRAACVMRLDTPFR